MRSRKKVILFSATAALLGTSAAQAQLTWDAVAGDGVVTHSNGVWDVSTANWTSDAGANNSVWVNGSDAIFDTTTNNTQIVIDVDAGVEVGDITLAPSDTTQNVILRGLADNTQITLDPGGATWALGGRYLELLNNTSQDLFLSMTSNTTLTVTSGGGTGGTLDTGEKPTGANWVAAGCTLDFQATEGVLKGNAGSVGQFDTVKFADNTTYVHDRNGNQTYQNNWDLGTGTVTFKNRWGNNGSVNLNGVISGDGTIVVACNATRWVRPMSTNNTFSGKYIVGTDSISGSELLNYNGDRAYGPVPESVVSNYFTLVNGGELKINGFEIHANRGITLDGKGVIINNTGPTVYGGKITGDGQLQVGRNEGSDGNHLYLTSNMHDYTGGTRIWQGSLTLQIDDTLPADGLLTLGGGSKNSNFRMNGYSQTIGGLNLGGGSSKTVWNNSTTNSTLTINVADGNDYSYNANINGSGTIDIVKDGPGTQRFGKTTAFSTPPALLTINDGVISWNSVEGPSGLTTVNSGATLAGTGTLTTNVVVNSGGSVEPGSPGGGNNTLDFLGDLDVSGMMDDNAGGLNFSFGDWKDKIVVTNVAGTGTFNMDGAGMFDLGFSDFTFSDQNGLTNQTLTLIVADNLVGTLDPTDLSGPVGDKGATGTLELSADGKSILLTVEAGDYSEFGQWMLEYGQSDGNADPDADGYDNLLEFAYGGDPTNAAVVGNMPTYFVTEEGGTNWLTLAYTYRSDENSGITYECLTANDLVYGTWTNAGITVVGTGAVTNGFGTVTNAIPMDGSIDFLGVFVEKE